MVFNYELDYYCSDNELLLIKSPQHIYYFEGQKIFNFSITEHGYQTIHQELQAHINFYKILKITFKND